MKTALYEEHLKLNGRMVDFAGWELPVMYSSIVEEHNATREKAGLFDVSHMGEILVQGEGAAAYISRLIPTRLSKLEPGKSMYSCLTNEQGGVIDDLFVYMVSDTEYYIVVNASTLERDLQWFKKHLAGGIILDDQSARTSKLDLQGPLSRKIAARAMGDSSLEELPRFHFCHRDYRGKRIKISQSGYTGEHGYEFYVGNDLAPLLWRDLMEAGAEYGIKAVGLGARDSLRLESCYSLYGHELNDGITPVEAGLGWIVSSQEDYIGRDVIDRQKREGAGRELVCFEVTGRGIPREGCRIDKESREIGISTSAGYSPTFKKGLGMALVETGSVSPGDGIEIIIRGNPVAARIAPRPFYKYNG